MGLYGSRLIDSVNFLVVSLISLVLSVLPSLFHSISQALAVGLCICFYQLLGEASQMTVMLGCKDSTISVILSGVAVSQGMSLKLGQSLVSLFLKFCFIFTHVPLVGRKNCGSKILWLDWCPNLSTGSLFCLLEMAISGSIS